MDETMWVARFYANPEFSHMRTSDDLALLKRALIKEYGEKLCFKDCGFETWEILYNSVSIGIVGKVKLID